MGSGPKKNHTTIIEFREGRVANAMHSRRSSSPIGSSAPSQLGCPCASTPDSRIEKRQSLFDSHPTEIQSMIRMGKVAIGYDGEMVRMDLGDPRRGIDRERRKRRDADVALDPI